MTLEPGANEIEVFARTSDGLEKLQTVKVTMREGAEDPPVPAGWHNGEDSFGFVAGELIVRKDNPISGCNWL